MKLWSLVVIPLFAAGLAGTAAMAQNGNDDCKAWSAAIQEREEGPALTATACAKTDTHDALLEIVCFGERVNMRYIHAPDKGADEFGPKRDFLFITNKGRRAVFMTFEGLDGAFTAYLEKDHPLFEMLMAARSLSIEDPTRRLRSQKMTLANSRDAITAVTSRCVAKPPECAPPPCPEPTIQEAAPGADAPAATAPAGGARPRTSGETGPSEDKR